MFILKLQNKYKNTFHICNEMYRKNEYIKYLRIFKTAEFPGLYNVISVYIVNI